MNALLLNQHLYDLTCFMFSEALQKYSAKETNAASEVKVEMASGYRERGKNSSLTWKQNSLLEVWVWKNTLCSIKAARNINLSKQKHPEIFWYVWLLDLSRKSERNTWCVFELYNPITLFERIDDSQALANIDKYVISEKKRSLVRCFSFIAREIWWTYRLSLRC